MAEKRYERFITDKYPNKRIAIVTCMDTRLVELLPAALGFRNGDVKIIKNAGGVVTNPFGSVIRSLLVAIIGFLLERTAYRPLRNANRLSAVVSALGASIFFQNAIMLIYGARFYVYPDYLRPDFTVHLFGLAVPGVRLLVIAASVILMLGLWAFIQRSRTGAAIRAVAIDPGAAQLMGINVDRIISLVFLIGPGLGGAAGLMVGIYYGQIDFTMGWTYGLKAFTAAVLGGIGSIPGAMVGGLVLGLAESFTTGYFSGNYEDMLAFGILILILIFRPDGILGKATVQKV